MIGAVGRIRLEAAGYTPPTRRPSCSKCVESTVKQYNGGKVILYCNRLIVAVSTFAICDNYTPIKQTP